MPQLAPLWTASSTGNRADSALETDDSLISAYFQQLAETDKEQLGANARSQLVTEHLALAQRAPASTAVQILRYHTHSVIQAIHRDMPYLVDSLTTAVQAAGHTIQLIAHPVFQTQRNTGTGALEALYPQDDAKEELSGLSAESFISIQTVEPLDDDEAQQLQTAVEAALRDVAAAMGDQQRMRQQAVEIAQELRESQHATDASEESAALLEWMATGPFLFIGYKEYSLDDAGATLHGVHGTGLGVLGGDDKTSGSKISDLHENITVDNPLIVTKTNARSRIYRHIYMDYIAVKTFNADGHAAGEKRFIGLWKPVLESAALSTVPIVRVHAERILDKAGYSQQSHSDGELMAVLEDYPRDEMLQMSTEALWERVQKIMQLGERRRTKLLLRPDVFGRFVTAMVYLPRDRYNTSVRQRIYRALVEKLGGESAIFSVKLTDSALARILFRIKLPQGSTLSPQVDEPAIEQAVVAAVRSWKEGVDIAALGFFGEESGVEAAQRWDEAFPGAYRVRFEIEDALEDITRFGAVTDEKPGVHISDDVDESGLYRVKLYTNIRYTLSEILPVLSEMGIQVVEEYPFIVRPAGAKPQYLFDLGVHIPESVELNDFRAVIEQTIAGALSGGLQADTFNQLVLYYGIDPQLVNMLRGYAHYLRQLAVPNTVEFMANTLLQVPAATKALIEYFVQKFSPEAFDDDDGAVPSTQRLQALSEQHSVVLEAIEQAPTLDADRVLRSYLRVIEATERTNLYQEHDWLSFKLSPQKISFAPQPRPAHEIWVHSPVVSGTHLRFGAVARGGLRWSDRPEDFRTEVLGLVQTQQTKNAVIVPDGAKGCFYPHQLPSPAEDRNAWVEDGKDAYRVFIRGLLDVTDNLENTDEGQLTTSRERIIRYDEPDAYLVVAADKGTAAFSDTANQISAEYNHWLGDAFASGGSVGYDHKAMGITARGAWESVKAHFAKLRHDVHAEDFTAVGIGDMSGDVFGNGMLRSRHTLLVAAFNHLHIFIDPNPEGEKAFAERQRLYDLPRSSWGDYNTELISDGGGVFERTAKSITITEQMRQRFGLDPEVQTMTPPELISAVLKAPVDLVYNGGIGTYIKASTESNDEVGDRANDAIRVDGRELRTRVVAEGGNLGATQLGRIEAAQNGVLLNTDAVDNSAGVDASDHEVNIKILIGQLLDAGELEADRRQELLLSMTDEVAEHILATNRAQNVLLTVESALGVQWMTSFSRHINWLEEYAGLDRELEAIPTTAEIQQRAAQGETLVTPEYAVLMAYTKIAMAGQVLESPIVDDEWFQQFAIAYFPATLRELAGTETIKNHQLRREIIALLVANHIVNTGGITMMFRAEEELGADIDTLVRAFYVGEEILELGAYQRALENLPADVDPTERMASMVELRRLMDRVVRWVTHNQRADLPVQDRIDVLHEEVQQLLEVLPELMVGSMRESYRNNYQRKLQAGFPEDLATLAADPFTMFSLLDIVDLASSIDKTPRQVAEIYFQLMEDFDVDILLDAVGALSRQTRWEALSRVSLREDLYGWLIEPTEEVLTNSESTNPDASQAVADWRNDHRRRVQRVQEFIDGVRDQFTDAQGVTDLSIMTVVLRRLRTLIV